MRGRCGAATTNKDDSDFTRIGSCCSDDALLYIVAMSN